MSTHRTLKRYIVFIIGFCLPVFAWATDNSKRYSIQPTSQIYAKNNPVWKDSEPWQFIFSLEGGSSLSSPHALTTTFPIVDPVSDEFFIYTSNNGTQTTWVGDVFAGAELIYTPSWRVQIGVDYNQRGTVSATGSLLQGADFQSADLYAVQYNILTRQLLVESKLLYQFKELCFPYFLLGVGTSINDATGYQTNVPPFLTFTRQYQDNKNQTSFSYTLGIGVDFNLSQRLRLGAGYRFSDLGQVSLGPASIDTTRVPGTLSETHFYANAVIGQITLLL